MQKLCSSQVIHSKNFIIQWRFIALGLVCMFVHCSFGGFRKLENNLISSELRNNNNFFDFN